MLSDPTSHRCRRSRSSSLSPKSSLSIYRYLLRRVTPCDPTDVFRLNLGLLPFADKTPLERAQFLESTDPFANIHAAAASGGQTAVPNDWDTDLHFTCFVQAPEAFAREAEIATGERRLIELDGGRAGSGDRGNLTDQLKVRSSLR